MSINQERQRILGRLHELEGECMTCGKKKCGHGTNTTLPYNLRRESVLRAINLDNHYGKDPAGSRQ